MAATLLHRGQAVPHSPSPGVGAGLARGPWTGGAELGQPHPARFPEADATSRAALSKHFTLVVAHSVLTLHDEVAVRGLQHAPRRPCRVAGVGLHSAGRPSTLPCLVRAPRAGAGRELASALCCPSEGIAPLGSHSFSRPPSGHRFPSLGLRPRLVAWSACKWPVGGHAFRRLRGHRQVSAGLGCAWQSDPRASSPHSAVGPLGTLPCCPHGHHSSPFLVTTHGKEQVGPPWEGTVTGSGSGSERPQRLGAPPPQPRAPAPRRPRVGTGDAVWRAPRCVRDLGLDAALSRWPRSAGLRP